MYEMRNVENRMHSVRIGYFYNMAAPIDFNNNAFNKDTAAVSLDRVFYPISLQIILNINNVSAVLRPE